VVAGGLRGARARAGRRRLRVPLVRHRLHRPAFAPATGTPEVCGLFPHEAIGFLRALRGLAFTGYDLVEVAPAYDTNAQTTALLAANLAYELLTLTALCRG
jgi:arginase family enzyme